MNIKDTVIQFKFPLQFQLVFSIILANIYVHFIAIVYFKHLARLSRNTSRDCSSNCPRVIKSVEGHCGSWRSEQLDDMRCSTYCRNTDK